jgi:hypothetical protein
MFGDEGDGAWLRWRALHAELVDGVAVPSVREARGGAEDPELLLLRAGTPLPAALTVGTYVSHREVPAEDRGRAVLLLRRVR